VRPWGVNPSTVLARMAVDALLEAGVAHVVLCPGSRSAPMAYALHGALHGPAPARGPARLHVRHDERAAAFTALGVGALGPGTGAVVTTSGTAVANLHPAVLEAHHANVPLVVLTADRPRALRGTWANQTTELQAGLFGDAVRARLDLADTDAVADPALARDRLAAVLAAAVGAAPGARPGPVHLDLGFSDPLLPDDDPAPGGRQGAPRVAPGRDTAEGGPGPVELASGPPTVVLAGDRSPAQALDLARATGWPLLAEPSSGVRTAAGVGAGGPYRLLLELADLGGAVRRAVVFGRPTLSRPVTRLLERDDVEVVVVSPYPAWPEPGRPVRRVHAVAARAADGEQEWGDRWRRAGTAARRALDAVLDADADGSTGGRLTGPLLAREVAAAMRPGEVLVAAASNPVRDLDLAAAGLAAGVRVLSNRGLSGIDGTLSTAVGAALGGARVRVLVGDLAFLHDLNGLLAGPHEARPDVQVVVLDDDGGGIFSLLEHGERGGRDAQRAHAFDRLFGTPHGADLAALCRGMGVPHRLVDDLAGLRGALADPTGGPEVVRVRADRSQLRDLHARIRTAVHAAVLETMETASA